MPPPIFISRTAAWMASRPGTPGRRISIARNYLANRSVQRLRTGRFLGGGHRGAELIRLGNYLTNAGKKAEGTRYREAG